METLYRKVKASERFPSLDWEGFYCINDSLEVGDYWDFTKYLNLGNECAWLEELPPQKQGWISVDNKPKPRVPVLVNVKDTKGRQNVLRACWIPKHFEEDDGNYQGDADYCEEKDMFYWPEGWYEWNDCEEIHWVIYYKVTHWMPLPEPPKTD